MMTGNQKELFSVENFLAAHAVVNNEDILYPRENYEQGTENGFNDRRGGYYFDIRIV